MKDKNAMGLHRYPAGNIPTREGEPHAGSQVPPQSPASLRGGIAPAASVGDASLPQHVRESLSALDSWVSGYVMADGFDPKVEIRAVLQYHEEQDLIALTSASVGDAPSDAVAHGDEHQGVAAAVVMMACERILGRTSNLYRMIVAEVGDLLADTAPPAAPVVSKIDWLEHAVGSRWIDEHGQDHDLWIRLGKAEQLARALSVPATDDKAAPAVDAAPSEAQVEAMAVACGLRWHSRTGKYTISCNADPDRLMAFARRVRAAAPTSPHDVDAVRGLVEKWHARGNAWALELGGLADDNPAVVVINRVTREIDRCRHELEAVLTAALRKPGDSA